MDKLQADKAAGVQDAIEATGASLLYLPPTVSTSSHRESISKVQGFAARKGRANNR
jgi:hypothetical protein